MYSIKAMDLKDEGIAEGRAEGRAEGKAEERANNVLQLMKALDLTFDKAADYLNIKEEDRDECRARIEKMKDKQPAGV